MGNYNKSNVVLVVTMPCPRSIQREVTNLSLFGGRSGRLHKDECLWIFDSITNIITPKSNRNETVDNQSVSSDSTASNDSAVPSSSSTASYLDDMSSIGSFSNINDDEFTLVDNNDNFNNGNQLIHLHSLVSALDTIGMCKLCKSYDMEQFFAYCETNNRLVIQRSKHLPVWKWIALLQSSLDVHQLYNKWLTKKKWQSDTRIIGNEGSKLWLSHLNQLYLQQLLWQTCIVCSAKKGKGTKSDLCQYDINLRFGSALQQMGVGGEQASILT